MACNTGPAGKHQLEIMAFGDEEVLTRPCVDCGLVTGRFCDYCNAADRIPDEEWAEGQLTPLCSYCDNKFNRCHFCRNLSWCRPGAHKQKANQHAMPTTAAAPQLQPLAEPAAAEVVGVTPEAPAAPTPACPPPAEAEAA